MSTAVALPRPGAAASRLRFVFNELALWLGLYPVYLAIRGLSIDSYGTALANAHDLISVERSLSVFHEAYAAMPSMHVGWSLLVGIFGFRALRGNALRWIFVLHPVVMATAVTATGNHYFLDSAAGVAVVACALVAIRRFNRKER